ncbi:MAG: SPOR domain-containing protein [Pseudomonadota bacterium]
MRLSCVAAAVLLAGACLATSSLAKSLAEGSSPVNFPPQDYEGRSFVDNDGCIYLRAGVDGNVTWVPRVSRNRQVICGQTPTFGAPSRVAATPPAAVEPEPAPAARAARATPPPVTAPAETSAPRAARRVAPVSGLTAPSSAAPRPRAPAQKAVTGQRVVRGAPAGPGPCAQADEVSNRWHNATGVRCTPQAQSPSSGFGTVARGAAVPVGTPPAPGAQRIVSVPAVPKGYRPVFDDGRLNPHRGLPGRTQVVAGVTGSAAAYDLAWTRSKPHRLYDRRTRRVVGHEFPGLTYPDTDISSLSRRDLAASYRPAPANRSPSRAAPQERQTATLATRSAPNVTKAPTGAKTRIQVATFADMAAARRAAQGLANAGLPTRIGKYTRQGQRRQVILLGPFESTGALDQALRVARGQGFRRAFARQ